MGHLCEVGSQFKESGFFHPMFGEDPELKRRSVRWGSYRSKHSYSVYRISGSSTVAMYILGGNGVGNVPFRKQLIL